MNQYVISATNFDAVKSEAVREWADLHNLNIKSIVRFQGVGSLSVEGTENTILMLMQAFPESLTGYHLSMPMKIRED